MDAWRTIGSKQLVNDRWLKLTADRCLLANGSVIEPYYVLHESDWVHIFAQEEDGRIVVVQQYRYAAGVVCVELPGGVIDEGERPLDAAKRELSEETGYSAAEWLAVGSMYANPARQTNLVHIFVARELSRSGEQQLDHSEDIEFRVVRIDEVYEMIDKNQFSQALHIASFYRCLRLHAHFHPSRG